MGFRLPPLKAKWNSKEISQAKFYFFDAGIARACAGLIRDEVNDSWRGHSFETLILNEVRAFNRYLKKDRNLFYYKFHNGYEIDLLIETQKKSISQPQQLIALEIKFSKTWDRRWNKPLLDLQQKSKGHVTNLIGVYLGKSVLKQNAITIYPVEIFLEELSTGKFF